ncbi:hypothetical protein WEI85_34735 [Actinomycetes bacterium KLBMP 9797]
MRFRRAAAVGVTTIVGILGLLGPSAAYAADDASTKAIQCTTLWTEDNAPRGGKVDVCKSWSGGGIFSGDVWGTVYDTHADGRSAYVRGWFDGYEIRLGQANGASNPDEFSVPYQNIEKVRVRIGLIDTQTGHICCWSGWW